MTHQLALVVGGGINQEIAPEVVRAVAATGVEIDWHRVDVMPGDAHAAREQVQAAADEVRRHGLGLKTRLITPPGSGWNLNVAFRRNLNLYAGVRAIRSQPGLSTRFPDLDLVIVRENSEGIYKGIEHEIVPGVVESIKVITRAASERIARFAFETARFLNRREVAVVHKANIMKMSDGLFLQAARDVAGDYAGIDLREVIVDAACMQLVLDPYQFDVMVMGNLYGDVLSSLCNGITGGISSSLGIDIGDDSRVYESIHGDAPHIIGMGIANPLPLLTPAIDLLDYLGESAAATALRDAVRKVTTSGTALTPDLGGDATTVEMTDAIIANLD